MSIADGVVLTLLLVVLPACLGAVAASAIPTRPARLRTARTLAVSLAVGAGLFVVIGGDVALLPWYLAAAAATLGGWVTAGRPGRRRSRADPS